jgi:predicted HTH domain antitoxin
MNVFVEIPDDLCRSLAETPEVLGQRIALDLAVYYYEKHLISLGKATELSRLPRGEFEAVLAERGIERNYSMEDLEADLLWSKRV